MACWRTAVPDELAAERMLRVVVRAGLRGMGEQAARAAVATDPMVETHSHDLKL